MSVAPPPSEPIAIARPSGGRARRRPLLALLVVVSTLALVDLALTLLVVRDGVLFGQPLPPFGVVTNAVQESWIAGLSERDGTDIGRFDAELGWDCIPSSRSADGHFTINRDGARGAREYAPLPPPGILRIVSFGDSFTFGDEIVDDKTYQAQLEARRSELEVLNFGVGGYGTDQALLRFRRSGTQRGAHVVFIGIMLENIGRNVNRYRPLWTPRTGISATKPRFVLSAGELELVPQPFADRLALHGALTDGSLFDTIREHEHWLDVPALPTGRWSSIGRIVGLLLAHRARSPERLWRATEAEPFRVSVEILARFHAEALASGAEAAPVLLFPAEEDLATLRQRNERYWQGLLDALALRGVPVIDLSAPLSSAQDRIDAGTWEAGLYWGAHLSGAGNHVVSNALEEWLIEKGLLAAR